MNDRRPRPTIRLRPVPTNHPAAWIADTAEEVMAMAHLRGHCHDSSACPICKARVSGYHEGYNEAIRKVAEG